MDTCDEITLSKIHHPIIMKKELCLCLSEMIDVDPDRMSDKSDDKLNR